MYTTVKMDMAILPFEALESTHGGHNVQHFDLAVEDFIEDFIQGSSNFPPTQFFFEPRKQRAVIIAISDMPPEIQAGDVIKKVCLDYVRKNLDYVEKITMLNASVMAKNPPEDIVKQSGGMPSRMPKEYTQDALIIVSQLRDDTSSEVAIRILDETTNRYVPMERDDMDINDAGNYNRFENLFDIDSVDTNSNFSDKGPANQMHLNSEEKEKLNMKALTNFIDRLVTAVFNIQYNNDKFNPKKDDKRN